MVSKTYDEFLNYLRANKDVPNLENIRVNKMNDFDHSYFVTVAVSASDETSLAARLNKFCNNDLFVTM